MCADTRTGAAKEETVAAEDTPTDPVEIPKALPEVDPSNAAQDPAKVKVAPALPPQEIDLEPAMYWELKAKRQELLIASERMSAAGQALQTARVSVAAIEQSIATQLKLKVPIGAYVLVDDGTRAVLHQQVRQQMQMP